MEESKLVSIESTLCGENNKTYNHSGCREKIANITNSYIIGEKEKLKFLNDLLELIVNPFGRSSVFDVECLSIEKALCKHFGEKNNEEIFQNYASSIKVFTQKHIKEVGKQSAFLQELSELIRGIVAKQ